MLKLLKGELELKTSMLLKESEEVLSGFMGQLNLFDELRDFSNLNVEQILLLQKTAKLYKDTAELVITQGRYMDEIHTHICELVDANKKMSTQLDDLRAISLETRELLRNLNGGGFKST